jgi:hypothetical protein
MPSACSFCGTALMSDEASDGVCERCRRERVQAEAPAGASALPRWGDVDAGFSEGRPPAVRGGGEEWATFRLGLLLLCFYQGLSIAVAGLILVLILIGSPTYHALQLPLVVPANAVLALVGLVGVGMLCTVPEGTRLRPLAISSAVSAPLMAVGVVAGAILAASNPSIREFKPGERTDLSALGPLLATQCLVLLAGVTFVICFTWLLAGAAHRRGDRGLMVGFIVCVSTWIGAVILFAGISVIVGIAVAANSVKDPKELAARMEEIKPTIELAGGAVGFVTALAFGLWLIFLLLRLRARTA